MLSKFDAVISNLARFKEIRDSRKSLHPLIKCLFIEFHGITQEEIQENLEFGLKLADCVGFQEYIDPTNTIGEKKEYKRDYQSSFACQQPFTRISIAEDGIVSPCCLDNEFDLSVGNVKTKSITDLWKSKEMEMIRDKQKQCLSGVMSQTSLFKPVLDCLDEIIDIFLFIMVLTFGP